mgnify:CR=1 FL=1
MGTDLSIKQKKEWAKMLYLKEHLTQAEVAPPTFVFFVSDCLLYTSDAADEL